MTQTNPPPALPSPTLRVSYGPHIRSELSTSQIMWMVNGALFPALFWAWFVFGWNVILISITSVVGALLGEGLVNHLRGRRSTLWDGSATCSGILLAYTLPPGLHWAMPLVGSFLGIILSKGVFGGLGYNIFNVALIGRALMMATFPVAMTTTWISPRWFSFLPQSIKSVDGMSTATPLALMKEKGLDAALSSLHSLTQFEGSYWWKLFFGFRPGSIGEVSVVFISLGALYLLWKGLIKLYIPLSIFAGLFLVSLLSPAPLMHLLSGGVWLGAFFMATDYVTSPTLPKGQVVFGLGIGVLTGMIRQYGGYPEGICYAILLMNILTPALNDWFRPVRVSTQGVPS